MTQPSQQVPLSSSSQMILNLSLSSLLGLLLTLNPGPVFAESPSNINYSQPFSPGQVGICDQDGKLTREAKSKLPKPRELRVGEWHIIGEVCPGEKFFPSSVILTPGASYVISAVGRWKDGWITVGPEGWWFPPLQAFNRIPLQRMFVLSGSVGSSIADSFVIGRETTWKAPINLPHHLRAELKLFPNDWASLYTNNRSLSPSQGGPMRVTIFRES